MQHVAIAIDCGRQCRPSSNFNYGQCDIFNTFGIERCNQGQCESKNYSCITTENVHTIEATSTSTLDDSNIDQQSTVAALAITIVILIVLLVIVSVALIWKEA